MSLSVQYVHLRFQGLMEEYGLTSLQVNTLVEYLFNCEVSYVGCQRWNVDRFGLTARNVDAPQRIWTRRMVRLWLKPDSSEDNHAKSLLRQISNDVFRGVRGLGKLHPIELWRSTNEQRVDSCIVSSVFIHYTGSMYQFMFKRDV